MKFVALVGLIDEADVIGACIDYHLSIGFDHIMITDLGSRDGSLEIVRERMDATGRVSLLHATSDMRKLDWPARMLETAIRDLAPDYVAYIDPDEFWIPRSGSIRTLKDVGSADVLSVKRYNAVQNVEHLSQRRHIDRHEFLYEVVFTERKPVSMASPPMTAIYSGPIGPKVMHSAVDVTIGTGGHAVKSEQLTRQVTPEDVIILHYPISSYANFEQKIRNAAETIALNPHYPETMAWHWRRMVAALQDGSLPQEYRAQVFSGTEIQDMVQANKAAPLWSILSARA